MNCQCVPSKPAVVRVSQSARSGGREFFCCPINNGCGFFAWVGQDIPMSLAFGRNRPQTTGKPSSYGVGSSRSSNSPQKTNGKFEAKICVHEILEGPPFVIWLSLQCPATPVINDLFSRLPPQQCKFSNTLKMWLFTFEMHDKIVTEFFTPPFESLRLVDLPRFLSKGLANFQRKVLKLNWELEPALNLNAGILDKLLNFQLEAVKFVVRRGGRAMLGDEMGCGKTFQAIAVMLHYRKEWPVLIVVPSSLMKQWPDEIRKYAGDLVGEHDIRIVGKSSDVGTALITIITYKVMDILVEKKLLTPDQFGVVIADESHNLKNKDSSRSLAVIPFLRKATVALCMTGTPEVNRPVELYSQLNGILPDVFNDYNQFVYRYCDAKSNGNLPGLNVSGHSNDKELNTLLCGLAMVRRSKDEVLSDLPEKRRELRYVNPDPVILPEIKRYSSRSKQLEEMITNSAGKDPSEVQAWTNEKQQILNTLYTLTGTSKILAIKEELVKLIEEARRERGIIVAQRAADATSAAAAASASAALAQAALHTQEDSSADEKEKEKEDNDGSDGYVTAHSAQGESDHVLAASDCEYVPSSKALRLLGSSHNSADNKLSGSSHGKSAQGKSVPGRSAAAPVLMELEDDIMTSTVHSLSDTGEDEDVGQQKKRLKTSITSEVTRKTSKGSKGSSGGGEHGDGNAGGYWEDDEECDYNLSDIKSSARGGHSKKKSKFDSCSSSDDEKACGLFDQRARNAAKAKGKSKTATTTTAKRSISSRKAGDMKTEAGGSGGADETASTSSAGSSAGDTAVCRVGQKIIVFFHHKAVLQAIEDALVVLQVKFIKIDGATPQGKRAKLIDQFQNDNVTDVALLSITACGVGLNLTRANVALFGELNWSLGVVLQAEDRIHRLGQKAKEVRIIYMIARNTVDEIVWEQIQRKHQVVGATVGTSGARSHSGGMKINSERQENSSSGIISRGGQQQQQNSESSYALAAAAKKRAEEEEAQQQQVLAAMAAYTNRRTTATSTSVPPVSSSSSYSSSCSSSVSAAAGALSVAPSSVVAPVASNSSYSGPASYGQMVSAAGAPRQQGSTSAGALYGSANTAPAASYSSAVSVPGMQRVQQNPSVYSAAQHSSSTVSAAPMPAPASGASSSYPYPALANSNLRPGTYPVQPSMPSTSNPPLGYGAPSLAASVSSGYGLNTSVAAPGNLPFSSGYGLSRAAVPAAVPSSATAAPTSAVPLFGNTEEFAYSAASQNSEATSRESRGSDNQPVRQAALPLSAGPLSAPHVQSVGVTSSATSRPVVVNAPQQSVPSYPPSMGSARYAMPPPPERASAVLPPPTSLLHAPPAGMASAVNATSTANVQTGKAPLAPEVVARMEANRLAAQAKLAKRREELQQQNQPGQQGQHPSAVPPVSSVSATPYQALSTMVPAAAQRVSPHKPLQTAQTFPAHGFGGSPAFGAALHSRQPSANLPPGIISNAPPSSSATPLHHTINPPQPLGLPLQQHLMPTHACALGSSSAATGHVFSTGRGSTLTVSEAQLRQANALLQGATEAASATTMAMAPPSISRVGGVTVATPSYPMPHQNTAPVRVAIPVPAPVSVSTSVGLGGPSMSSSLSLHTTGAPTTSSNYGNYGGSASSSSSTAPPPPAAATAPSIPAAPVTSTASVSNNAQGGLLAGTMYFDGGALGNPGKAGAGYQIFASNGRTIQESAVKMKGVCTNNQAEYVGLIHGMTAALRCGVQDLQVYGDSDLVVKQMNGLYKVKNPILQGMHQRAQALRSRFRLIQLHWIPREKNGGADALSKQAMYHSEQVTEAADWFNA